MSLMLTLTDGLFSTAAACRSIVMNAAHRAGTTKNAKRYLGDMLILRFVSNLHFAEIQDGKVDSA
jgi:hypothetical protein